MSSAVIDQPALLAADLPVLSDDALLDVWGEVERLRNRLAAFEQRVIVEVEQRGLPGKFGARDVAALARGDEYCYHVDNLSELPAELRPLAREAEHEGLFLVGLAMAERFTGLDITPEDVVGIYGSAFYETPNGVYFSSPGT